MNNLKIEYVPISELNAYVNNAKEHPAEQVEQIKKSILEFGMNDPIAVWKDNVIIEGHGRLLACAELGEDYSVVPIIRLDHLTDEQRRAYALVHNKLTMNSDFNLDLLDMELANIENVSMVDFGFDDFLNGDDIEDDIPDIAKYSRNVKVPQYEPTGDMPEISDLVDCGKEKELVEEIDHADIPHDIKEFLKIAAARHNVFNYRNIAEFYCHQTPEVQRLMEKSALVIIDVDDAIANGYVRLSSTLAQILDEDYDAE